MREKDMSKHTNPPRPAEQQAVYTTIVGGRPPGSGTATGKIPQGIEVLVKKAAIDPKFRAILLARRAEAAKEIALELTPAETAILQSTPRNQLKTIIASTRVSPASRRAFLGKAASVMLAALGVQTAGCKKKDDPATDTQGIRIDGTDQQFQRNTTKQRQEDLYNKELSDRAKRLLELRKQYGEDYRDFAPATLGNQPDRPTEPRWKEIVTRGIRPDKPFYKDQ
jgi:hypothetical protein